LTNSDAKTTSKNHEASSEKINLGVIGIGSRCTYVLTSMLGPPDVRCVAIADVQKSRREAGKTLVDKLAANSDCVIPFQTALEIVRSGKLGKLDTLNGIPLKD
jgi:predicted dehydrogenase